MGENGSVDYKQATAQTIRDFRAAQNLTRNDFARRFKVATTTVYAWETGKQAPRPHHARALAQAGCPLDESLPAPISGATIRKWRLENDLTQSLVADLLGVHWSTVSSWETTGRGPKPPARKDLLALGCPPDDVPDNAPSARHTGGCRHCPDFDECARLRDQSLWCLCEIEPPSLADMFHAFAQDPDAYPLDPDQVEHARRQIPDPEPPVPPGPPAAPQTRPRARAAVCLSLRQTAKLAPGQPSSRHAGQPSSRHAVGRDLSEPATPPRRSHWDLYTRGRR